LLAAGLPTPSLVTDTSVSKQKTWVVKYCCVCCSQAVISNHCLWTAHATILISGKRCTAAYWSI